VPTRSPRGTYLQIAEHLRAQITDGTLPVGAKVPSEASLSAQYGVARGTARRALAELEREGLVTVTPARGRRVGPAKDQEAPLSHSELLAELRSELEAGEYESGAAFLSVTQVCERFGVTRHTARRVLTSLEDAGLVIVVHGKGRYVAEPTR
jgi:DNA-binding GntR family transcriptional regulator